MAFLSRFSNLLKPLGSKHARINSPFLPLGSKHVRIGLCTSNSPLFPSPKSMSAAKLFIGGLAYETDESDLQDVFQQYGSLIEVKIVTDRDSGRSRGFGFVTYISRNAASNALWHMDGKVLCGRRIKVELAHQHCPRPSVRVNESGLEVNESGFEVNEFLYDSLNDSRYEFLNGYDEELKREWKNAMKADVEEARQYVSYLVSQGILNRPNNQVKTTISKPCQIKK